jgi:hypothetical protein
MLRVLYLSTSRLFYFRHLNVEHVSNIQTQMVSLKSIKEMNISMTAERLSFRVPLAVLMTVKRQWMKSISIACFWTTYNNRDIP